MNESLIISIMAGLLVSSATISGSETACFNLSQEELLKLEQDNDRLGNLVVRLMKQADKLLLVILICNNAINIAYFALASLLASKIGGTAATLVPLIALGGLILFGEIVPKVVASERSAVLARLIAPLLWMLTIVMTPIVRLCEPLLDKDGSINSFPTVTADEVKLVIENSRDSGVVPNHVHDRMVEVIDLAHTPVRMAMTHRLDLPSVERTASFDEAVNTLREKPGPYLLVIDEEENGVGLLTAQDLLRPGKISKRMRKPVYVPSVTNLAQALELFQKSDMSAGIVIDEYGTTAGILTLAHLSFELLGDGASEDIPDADQLEQLDDNRWRLSGRMSIEPWAPLLDDEDITAGVSTIAGFLSKVTGTVPQQGDQLLYNNLLFKVERCEGRRIASVIVEKIPTKQARRMTRNQGIA